MTAFLFATLSINASALRGSDRASNTASMPEGDVGVFKGLLEKTKVDVEARQASVGLI